MIVSLISPTVKDTSNVRNVSQYFTPDVASRASLLSLLVESTYILTPKPLRNMAVIKENNHRRSGLWN